MLGWINVMPSIKLLIFFPLKRKIVIKTTICFFSSKSKLCFCPLVPALIQKQLGHGCLSEPSRIFDSRSQASDKSWQVSINKRTACFILWNPHLQSLCFSCSWACPTQGSHLGATRPITLRFYMVRVIFHSWEVVATQKRAHSVLIRIYKLICI